MKNEPGIGDPREIVFPVLLVLSLFLTPFYVPLVGLFIGMLTPLPLVFVYLKRGPSRALTVLVATSLVLLGLQGGLPTVLFVVEYGGMAMVMGEMIHRCFLRENVVLLSSILPVFCGFIVLNFIFSGQETGFAGIMKEKIHLAINQTIKVYKETGRNAEQVQALEMYSREIARLFVRLLPAWFISGSIMSASINYLALKKLWIRWFGEDRPYFRDPPFREWVLTDHFIWVFIASGLLLLPPQEYLNILGLNLLFCSLLIYTIHGTAILLYWLKQHQGNRFLLYMVIAILTVQPLFLIFVAGCGIFDIWFDFRKLRVSPSGDGAP